MSLDVGDCEFEGDFLAMARETGDDGLRVVDG